MCFDAESRLHSAKRLTKGLLIPFRENPDIVLLHREKFLHEALWKITEAETINKHRTRYCSYTAFTLPESNLRHDHVYQRSKMVNNLLDCGPEQVDEILAKAVGCAVTLEEHYSLNKCAQYDGWDRYQKVGIKVVDVMKTQESGGKIQFHPKTL
jgi:hypothetical protein